MSIPAYQCKKCGYWYSDIDFHDCHVPDQGQKKSHSFLESIFNVIVGFGINMGANLIVLPWFGFKVSVGTAFNIGVIFTVISIVRSYVLRRIFNRVMLKDKG